MDPWEVSLNQVSSGAFVGTIQFARIGEFLIYSDCWSQHTMATGALPAGYFGICGPAEPDSCIDWCDAELNTRLLALALPDAELDFIIPPQTPHLVLLLPVHFLKASFGEESASCLLLSKDHQYQCDPRLGRRFLNRLQWMLDRYTKQPALLADPDEPQAAQTCLLDDLAELGLGRRHDQSPIRLSARRRAVQRALNYTGSLRERISVPRKGDATLYPFR